MAKDLQELRKEGGFKTAKDFALECGITPSTYARYEKDPSGIPLKNAWKMADALGCSIDAIVGRPNPETADERGEIQKRYDALTPASRSLVDDFFDFAESRETALAERERQEREAHYMQVFRRYQEMFFAEIEKGDGDMLLVGTSDELRARFEEFMTGKIDGADMSAEERKEVSQGIMRAYDAFNSSKAADYSFAYMRL